MRICGLMGLAFVFCFAARAGDFKRHYHESFEAGPETVLVLNHGDGDVIVTPWNKDRVDIDVTYHMVTRGLKVIEREFRVDFERDGHRINVRSHESCVIVGMGSCRTRTHLYRVRAPGYVSLVFRGDDGDVEVSDWQGEIDCRNMDGDLTFTRIKADRLNVEMDDGDLVVSDLQGSLHVACADGAVIVGDSIMPQCHVELDDGRLELDRCRGSLRFRMADGGIIGRNLEIDRVEAQSDDGDVSLQLDATSSIDVLIVTADGNVNLKLWPQFSGEYSIETEDGGLRVRVPGASEKRDSRDGMRVAGRVGKGTSQVRILSEGGDIGVSL